LTPAQKRRRAKDLEIFGRVIHSYWVNKVKELRRRVDDLEWEGSSIEDLEEAKHAHRIAKQKLDNLQKDSI